MANGFYVKPPGSNRQLVTFEEFFAERAAKLRKERPRNAQYPSPIFDSKTLYKTAAVAVALIGVASLGVTAVHMYVHMFGATMMNFVVNLEVANLLGGMGFICLKASNYLWKGEFPSPDIGVTYCVGPVSVRF